MANADTLVWIIDNDDLEGLALFLGTEEGLLDEVMVGIGKDDLAILNHVSGSFNDDVVCKANTLADKVVDRLAKEFLCVDIWEVDVDLADLELQPANGVTHGEAHGSASCEVLDLRVEDMGREMAGETSSMGRGVGINDLWRISSSTYAL